MPVSPMIVQNASLGILLFLPSHLRDSYSPCCAVVLHIFCDIHNIDNTTEYSAMH